MDEREWPPALLYDPTAMTLKKALPMIDAAKAKSQKITLAVTIAVCDARTNLVALEKMDNCSLLSLKIAINKARKAVLGMIPTHQWGHLFKGTTQRAALLWFHSGWITFMGGFPVVIDGRIIGGLGVSGRTWKTGSLHMQGCRHWVPTFPGGIFACRT